MLAALALRAVAAALVAGAPVAGAPAGITGAPAGITVPAPPRSLAQVRPAEMGVLQQIGAPAAWHVTRGKGVTVAVLDTGVDGSAPDLAGEVTAGPDYVGGADPKGYKPPLQHGTYIASLIAGHGRGPGDAMGVIGVAPQAKVLSIRVIPDDGEPGLRAYDSRGAFSDAVGDGIYYAVRHGASVINLSLGSQQATAYERGAVSYALSHGVVIVASAGNSGTDHSFAPYVYPAAFPGVIAVAAVGPAGARASFSEQNSSVIVSAPGVNVLGAGPGGEYINADGTSPAAALVTGVVALIQARYPGLAPALVEQALITTASRRPAGGYSVDVGFGEVNAPGALKVAAAMAGQDADGPDAADGSAPDSNLTDSGSMYGAVSIPGLSMTADPGKRLARSPAPIAVIHRDRVPIIAWTAVATGASVLAALALAALVVLLRRPRRRPVGVALAELPPPGDDLIGLPQAPAYIRRRSRYRSFMFASIFTLPVIQARAMFMGCAASDTTWSLLAVSRMSAVGSSGPTSRTGSLPSPRTVTNVMPRSETVTLIVRLPKYSRRSSGLSSESRPASFCSARWHSSAVCTCASLIHGR